MHKSFGAIATFLLSLAVFMMYGVLATSDAMADGSASANAKITVTSACTFLSGGGSYAATVSNGQSSEITANAIDVSCNDSAGYAIYAIGYSDNTYNSGYHTDLISGLGNDYNIKTSGTDSASYWKMKIINPTNAVVAGSFTSYQQIPSAFTKVASYTSNTTSGSITPKYEIFVGSGQAAGTYTGKVKYTLVHPNTMVAGTYNVAYNANGGTGTMTGSTGLYNFEEFTLPASTFAAPSGYQFAGWCTTNTAGSYACDGTSYVAGDKVTSLASAGSTATLYAYYEEMPYIQDLTLANCPTEGMTVYDKRDKKDYTVKLINGQCWMTQNLRYLGDTGSAAGTMTIGNNNSNVANKSITLYSLDSSNAGSFNAYSSHCDSNGYNYACVYDSGSTSTGVWYNFYVASAGTISTDSNSTASTSDICPAGWHLPSGPNTTANTDYNKLVGNTTSGWQNPTAGLTAFSAVDGGYYYNGTLRDTDSGTLWSATAYDTTGRHSLDYSSSSGQFYGHSSDSRRIGFFVRCVRSS